MYEGKMDGAKESPLSGKNAHLINYLKGEIKSLKSRRFL
jgi:hypothetical protein